MNETITNKSMKNLLFFFFLSLSISAFSQLSNSQSNWSNGFLNKRVLQTHYEKSKADSLSKLVGTYVEGFYCHGGKCKYSQINEDYYISVKMNSGYLKIKYYFGDFDALKMDELIPKIEDQLN